jgi:hypothetical protein
MRRDVPHETQGELMDVAQVGHRERCSGGPTPRVYAMAIDPVSSVAVSRHLHVLAELFIAYRATLTEELLDLLEDEGIALDSSRMVGFL